MFINKIQTKYGYIDKTYKFIAKEGKRTLTYGKLSNGTSIAIDNYYKDGKIAEKRFVMWNDNWQKIVNKIFNPKTKRFDRIG